MAVDAELRVTFLNPAMRAVAERIGFRGAEPVGAALGELLPGLDGLEKACRAVLAEGRSIELYVRGPDRAGPTRVGHWQVDIAPVRSGRPGPLSLAVTVRDVRDTQRESARIAALQAVTAALSGAGSLDEVLRVALTEARAAVGAAAAFVGLLPAGRDVLRTTSVGLPPSIDMAVRDLPLSAPLPGPTVTRDGRPRYYPDRAGLAAEFPEAVLAEHGSPYQATAIEPVQAGPERLGFLAVLFLEAEPLSTEDRQLLASLARQCAVAADRARRSDVERAEREQAQGLQALAAQLAVASGVADVARILANEGASLLGASIANVSTYDPDTRLLTMRDASPGTPAAVTSRFARYSVDDPLPSRELFATGQPVLLSSFEERDRRYPALADVQVPQQAWANLLLQVDGRPLGAVGFAWHDPRQFAPDEVRRMQLIADLCAGALERARLADEQRKIAEALQRGLLPSQLPRLRGWRLAARYQPAGTAALVGGDWYDAFPLPGHQLGLLIGDVAGHGVPAAALMGQMRALGRAEARAGADPADVVARLN
ncbi:MAG TPA: GAF domain-containing protein, partial [Frankiaceae bacterium]|nr:GAF domain-containing protein [Frankiaceae bacterium]